MSKNMDLAIGGIVLALAIGTVAYFLMRNDDCLEKARGFAATSPAVTAKAGKILSVRTSSWLSGQTVAKAGQRSFYYLVEGDRATVRVMVSADRASCTCRLESVN
jgi:hypothetical protein